MYKYCTSSGLDSVVCDYTVSTITTLILIAIVLLLLDPQQAMAFNYALVLI